MIQCGRCLLGIQNSIHHLDVAIGRLEIVQRLVESKNLVVVDEDIEIRSSAGDVLSLHGSVHGAVLEVCH